MRRLQTLKGVKYLNDRVGETFYHVKLQGITKYTLKSFSLDFAIFDGGRCKRKAPRGNEFYRDKKTILYYIKIKGLNNEDLYKIGVTLYKGSIEKSLKKRFHRQEYELIQSEIFKDGSEAFVLEQQILKFNREYRYLGEKVLKAGNTELFIKNLILD